MLAYEKLSEKTLGTVLSTLFEKFEVVPQYRIKTPTQTYVIDYYVKTEKHTFLFEYDGPTHFTKPKTQLRDLHLQEYCDSCGFYLIRVPYFMQIDNQTLPIFFENNVLELYKMNTKQISCNYSSGFYDDKIVLPGEFNSAGWANFNKFYTKMVDVDRMSVMQQIYESLFDFVDKTCEEHVFGIDYRTDESKMNFIRHYPT